MDERLLIEAAQTDPTRFGDLYEDNFARVYAFISRRVRNRQEAQDITSQVFARALANLRQFEWQGKPFAAYLYLPRAGGAQVAQTSDEGRGMHVDLDANCIPLGIEITAPGLVNLAELNALLVRYGVAALDDEEWAPLAA